MINDRDIERILDRADIVDVISDYVQLKKKGSTTSVAVLSITRKRRLSK